jgi:hypothetical protein
VLAQEIGLLVGGHLDLPAPVHRIPFGQTGTKPRSSLSGRHSARFRLPRDDYQALQAQQTVN